VKDFFVSYNKADLEWAKWMVWHLEEMGFTTIAQFKDFPAAQNFVVNMGKALETSARMMAVLSPEYITALYTTAEWTAVFTKDPDGSKGLLVPVRVREVQKPALLEPLVYIDLSDLDEAASVGAFATGIESLGLSLGSALSADARWGPAKPEFPYPKVDVLIEYCADDSARVEQIAKTLEGKGLLVRRSRWRIIGAGVVPDSPPPSYLRATCRAVCLGENSLPAWSQKVLKASVGFRTQGETVSVIPVVLPGADDGVRNLFPELTTWVGPAEAGSAIENAAKGITPAQAMPLEAKTPLATKIETTRRLLEELKKWRDAGLLDPEDVKKPRESLLEDLLKNGR
jgi:hypothetical protein